MWEEFSNSATTCANLSNLLLGMRAAWRCDFHVDEFHCYLIDEGWLSADSRFQKSANMSCRQNGRIGR